MVLSVMPCMEADAIKKNTESVSIEEESLNPKINIDLGVEGQLDWVGIENENIYRKNTNSKIKLVNLSERGNPFTSEDFKVCWKNGKKKETMYNNSCGLYFPGKDNGYEIQVNSNKEEQVLKLYTNVFNGTGKINAFLEKSKDLKVSETYISNPNKCTYKVFTIKFKSNKKDDKLIVKANLISDEGNITFIGASLGESTLYEKPKNLLKVEKNENNIELLFENSVLRITPFDEKTIKVNFIPNNVQIEKTLIVNGKEKNINYSFKEMKDKILISTDCINLEINKNPLNLIFKDKSEKLLLKDNGDYIRKLNFNHESGQNFYGIRGYENNEDSRDGILRNKGAKVEAGIQGDCGAPFTFTNRYGILVNSDGGEYEINDKEIKYKNISKLDTEYYVMAGNPRDIMKSLRNISGEAPMFPKWALGFTNSMWGTDQKEITEIIKTYRQKNIPIDNFTLDFDWKAWGADNYGEWRWNTGYDEGNVHPNKFPDGQSGKFAKDMGELGIKLSGILKPRIIVTKEDGSMTSHGKYSKEKGFWYPGVNPYLEYFSGKLAVDLNYDKKQCRSWYWEHLKDAFDTGIVGWWNDEADHSGEGKITFNNMQHLNMQRGLYEGQREYSDKRVWSINRNFYLGAQRYAYGMWSGDINSGFDNMANQRERMLTAINLGQTKWGMDTGGFFGDPDSENYARWMQFSAFTPIFRVHGHENARRMPWEYGEIAEKAAKEAIELRYKLIPYIYSYEKDNMESGLGIVRPLIYDYPTDEKVENTIDSWMFGDYLLVAPVVDKGQEVKEIYLPKGTWFDYTTGKSYEGPQTIEYKIDNKNFSDIPLFIKAGAIIPSQEKINYVGEKHIQQLYVDMFPSNETTSFKYYDDDGETYGYEKGDYYSQNIKMTKDNGKIIIHMDKNTGTYEGHLKEFVLNIHTKLGQKIKINGEEITSYKKSNDKYGAVISLKVPSHRENYIEIK